MDWETLYPWIEARTGVAYDCNEELNNLGGDAIFIDPYGWYVEYLNVIDHLKDIISTIKDYSDEIPDDMGSETDVVEFVNEYFTNKFITVLNDIESKLLMNQTSIKNMAQLDNVCETLHEYVGIFVNEDLEDIENQELIDKYDEENDNVLRDTFNVHQSDCSHIYDIIQSIRGKYEDEDE